MHTCVGAHFADIALWHQKQYGTLPAPSDVLQPNDWGTIISFNTQLNIVTWNLFVINVWLV